MASLKIHFNAVTMTTHVLFFFNFLLGVVILVFYDGCQGLRAWLRRCRRCPRCKTCRCRSSHSHRLDARQTRDDMEEERQASRTRVIVVLTLSGMICSVPFSFAYIWLVRDVSGEWAQVLLTMLGNAFQYFVVLEVAFSISLAAAAAGLVKYQCLSLYVYWGCIGLNMLAMAFLVVGKLVGSYLYYLTTSEFASVVFLLGVAVLLVWLSINTFRLHRHFAQMEEMPWGLIVYLISTILVHANTFVLGIFGMHCVLGLGPGNKTYREVCPIAYFYGNMNKIIWALWCTCSLLKYSQLWSRCKKKESDVEPSVAGRAGGVAPADENWSGEDKVTLDLD